jgi:SAM-dependent methyltransferase
VDQRTLARAYDRSADGYDERFRELQRQKYRAAAPLLDALRAAPRELAVDAGAGTALFAEWLCDEGEPHPALRARLRELRWVALDLSPGMLRLARPREVLPVLADLALPPLRPASCALAVAFTSLLEDKPAGLRALSRLLRPGGALVASLLRDEAPHAAELARWSGLSLRAGPLPAGQDVAVLLAQER